MEIVADPLATEIQRARTASRRHANYCASICLIILAALVSAGYFLYHSETPEDAPDSDDSLTTGRQVGFFTSAGVAMFSFCVMLCCNAIGNQYTVELNQLERRQHDQRARLDCLMMNQAIEWLRNDDTPEKIFTYFSQTNDSGALGLKDTIKAMLNRAKPLINLGADAGALNLAEPYSQAAIGILLNTLVSFLDRLSTGFYILDPANHVDAFKVLYNPSSSGMGTKYVLCGHNSRPQSEYVALGFIIETNDRSMLELARFFIAQFSPAVEVFTRETNPLPFPPVSTTSFAATSGAVAMTHPQCGSFNK